MIGIIIYPGPVPTTEEVYFDSGTLSAEELLGCQRTDHLYLPKLDAHGYKLRLFYSTASKGADMFNPVASLLSNQQIKGTALLIDGAKNITKKEYEVIVNLIDNDSD